MFNKQKYFDLIITLCFLPLLFFRDLTPRNELKYLSIVREAFERGDFITFYNHGEIYADKPPLYFWLIMLEKLITGEYNTTILIFLFTFIPAILIIKVMQKWSSEILDVNEQLLASLMLMTTSVFLVTAVILRMDMLMVLFIVLSLYNFYKFYTCQAGEKEIYLFYFYMFMALFTKGPFGLLIPLLSVIVFLFREKKLSKIKEFKPLRGIILVSILCALWFVGVWLEGGGEYFYKLTVKQTVGRGLNAFTHKRPFYYYIKSMWGIFFPWSFPFAFSLFFAIKNKKESISIERFFSSVIITGFILLSSVSGKLALYTLPLAPFMIFYTVIIIKKSRGAFYIKLAIFISAFVSSFLCPIYFYYLKKGEIKIPGNNYIYISLVLLLTCSLYSMAYVLKNKVKHSIVGLSIGLLLLFFINGFNLNEINSYIALKNVSLEGKRIAQQNSITKYYAYNFSQIENIDVYLNQDIENIYSLEQLKELLSNERVILFIQEKRVRRDTRLEKLLKTIKYQMKLGEVILYST